MPADSFRTFARYNAWANRKLYAVCATLPGEALRADRKAFFRSILGTLNHLLVADRVWLGRIENVPPGVTSLDQILFDDVQALGDARRTEDERLIALTDRLTEQTLNRDLAYRTLTMGGQEQRTPLTFVLAHLFNHQTHHRGQVHTLLSQAGVAPPALDLIYYLRETS